MPHPASSIADRATRTARHRPSLAPCFGLQDICGILAQHSHRRTSTMRISLVAVAACLFAIPALAAGPNLPPTSKPAPGRTPAPSPSSRQEGQVQVKIDLKNLPVGEHAVHIHAAPHCDAPDFKTAGGHFNPTSKQHGTRTPRATTTATCPRTSPSARATPARPPSPSTTSRSTPPPLTPSSPTAAPLS